MEKLICSPLAAYVASEDLAFITDLLENNTREGCREEITLKTGAGNELPVLFSCCPVELEGKPGVGVVITDISTVKEAERQLTIAAGREKTAQATQEGEERLRLAMDSAKMGIFDWDVLLDRITWSHRSKDLFGSSSGKFGGTYAEFMSVVYPEDRPMVEKAVALSKTAQVPYACEFRIVQPDGPVRWWFARGDLAYDSDGQATRMRGTVVDITEGKQTENKLWNSRIKLETALNSMSDAVFICDKEGRFIDVNEAFAAFHKFRNKAECPKTLAEYLKILDVFMIDGEPVPLEQWAVPRALLGESGNNVEYTLRRKDTGETWMGSYCFGPIRNNQGQIVGSVVTGRDITEQKRNEQSLRKAESHRVASLYARSLIETSLDPLVTINPEGVITDVNAATEAVTGYPRDELIGSEFSDYFTDPMMARTGYQQVFKTGLVRDYELELRHRDGHLTSVLYNAALYRDETGKVKGVFAAARDITRRKFVETELAHAHNLLITIINALPIRVFWKDLNLRYLGCNTSFAHDTGLEQPDEIIGKDDNQMPWSDQAKIFQTDDTAVMESGIAKLDFEEPLMTSGGQSIWLRTSKVPLRNQDNEIFGLLGIYENITEHKRAKDKLEQLSGEQQAMLDNELVGIARTQNRRIVWNNKAVNRIYGYGPGELEGQSTRILYPDDAAFLAMGEDIYAQLNSHGSYRAQVEMVRKDGEKLWIDINGAHLSGTNDEFLWLLADITPIKKYQDEFEQIA
ncbi:MAG: PAS domain S-box protein, partial [Methylococcaceae bacterium]